MERKFFPPKIIVDELTRIYQNKAKAISVAAGIVHWGIVEPQRSGAKWVMSIFGLSWLPIHSWIEVTRFGHTLRDVTVIQEFSEMIEELPDNYYKLLIESIHKTGILRGCGTVSARDIDKALQVFDEFFNTNSGEKAITKAAKWGSALEHPVVVSDRVYKASEVKFKRSSNMIYCDSCGELIACCSDNRDMSETGEAICCHCNAEMHGGKSRSCEAYECHAINCPYSSWSDLHKGVKRDNSLQKYSSSSGALF